MVLKTLAGKTMFIDDEAIYKEYLERSIMNFQKINQDRRLNKEEENELQEKMNLYNQIIDYMNKENEEVTAKHM